MGRKKKPWINKKTATSYKLVYRGQDDPLSKELEHPQMVLAPLTARGRDSDQSDSSEGDEQFEEQNKFGIYFGDEYNYMQHLKSSTALREATLLKQELPLPLDLPSEVFPSKSLLPPLPPFDPFSDPHELVDKDIEAALEGEFDFSDPEGLLEDDFVFQANQVPEGELFYKEFGAPPDQWSELMGNFNPWSKEEKDQFCDDDRQSKFTECSMTSSTVARSEGKQLLDAQFERLIEEYDEGVSGVQEEDVVAVDDVKTSGDQLLEYVMKQFKHTRFEDTPCPTETGAMCEDADSSSDSDIDSKLEAMFFQPPEVDQWDCESILSTYSNLYNHPKLITIPVSNKHMNKDDDRGKESVATDDVMFTSAGVYQRTKGESSEDKRERKTAVKKERREARDRKKQTKQIYKDERTSFKNRMSNISIVPVV